MSEEIEDNTPDDSYDQASDNNIDVADNTNEAQNVTNDKPAGYYPVDFKSATPEQLQDRFDYLYKQVKDGERTKAQIERETRQLREVAAEQAKMIDDLSKGVYQVVDHIQTKNFAESEASLRQQMQAAYEAGDYVALTTIQDQLFDLKVQKQNALNKPKPQVAPKVQTQEQAYAPNGTQAANDAFNDGDISEQERNFMSAWAEERDERGMPLRSWVNNSTGDPNNPDPDYVKAWVVANQVFNNPNNQNLTFQQKLAEIDKRMGVRKPSVSQSVLGGNLTTKPRTAKVTLSPEAEKLAIRTRYGASKGAKTDAEYIEAYRKQIATVRGARK